MKNPPPPHAIAANLRAVVKLLEGQPTCNKTKAQNGLCRCPIHAAALLAARGWPTGTSGRAARSSDPTSTTETAGLTSGPFDGLDDKLTDAMRQIWTAGLTIQEAMATIHAHAPDDDPLPAGAGECQRCGHFCNPRQRGPNDRLRSGWCFPCYQAWTRAGRPDRSAFNTSAAA